MIFTVTLNPAVDKTVILPDFSIGKVNRITNVRMDPGGKGINVSKVIKSLGANSVAMGIVGGAPGEYIQTCLDAMGIEHDFLIVQEPTRTNMKVVDPQLHTNTDINEPGASVSPDTLEQVYEKLASRVQPGDVVVLAGKTPPGADEGLYRDWIHRLHALEVKVYLDVDGVSLDKAVEALPDLIKPNDQEFSQLTGQAFSSLEDIAKAARAMVGSGIGQIAVSLGADGVLFVSEQACVHAQGLKVPVKSTVGAGDATMAALVYGHAAGLPSQDIMKLALAAGAASVMCEGTQAASADEVRRLAEQVKLHSLDA